MNNPRLKKLIIFLFIILLITSIIIIGIKFYLNNKNYINKNEGGDNVFENYGKTQSGKVDYRSYFDIKKYIQKYMDTINVNSSQYGYYDKNGEYISTVNENEKKQKIYNLLSNKYINENSVTVENLYNHIDILEKSAVFVPVELSLIQEGEIKSFLVYGLIESAENYSVIDELFAVINIDIRGYKFSIEPINGKYTSISEININKLEDTIIANEDNEFYKAYVKTEDIPAEYIEIFKGLALGAPEKLYNLLDEEYKNAKFGSLDEFKKYIDENKSEIVIAKLDKYQTEVDGSKVRYVCIDKKGNYYIINQNEALADYNIMLDIYTVDLAEFIEKYDNSENNEKVILNVKKLKEAIENEDYKYVYNKLNPSFRETNFKTQQDFEKFIKEKYDEQDKIEYLNYEEVTGVHVYTIKITNANKNKEQNAKIVMKLKDNRDFELSFSAEN